MRLSYNVGCDFHLIQNLVTHIWISLDPAEKAELRHFLMQHLLRSHASMPSFVRVKLIKVVVFIGRTDWPHDYPEFLSHILQVWEPFLCLQAAM